MRYTLEQACRRLAAYDHAYGNADVKDAINAAVQALAGLTGWECLRKVLRFTSATPVFSLPQGCAGLVRACVNGRPSTVRGQDFQFIQSGPGDMARPPVGFTPVPFGNIADMGVHPIMVSPPPRFRLFAMADGADEPFVTVRGPDPDGRLVRANVPIHAFPVYDKTTGELTSGEEPESVEPVDQELTWVNEVVLDPCAEKYVSLYAKDSETGAVVLLSRCHPAVSVPVFRWYRISDMPPGRPVELLVETRIDPLPLVEPTDVLPFDGVEPIEYMIMYEWKMQSSEIDAARKFKEEAASWLKAQEVTNDMVQTELIINGSMRGSLGVASMDTVNI